MPPLRSRKARSARRCKAVSAPSWCRPSKSSRSRSVRSSRWRESSSRTSPSRERSLDEVKDQVEARWREQEIATRLEAKATSILDKLKAGATLSDVAAAEHLKVETLSDLKRGQASGPLSAAGVDAVFR